MTEHDLHRFNLSRWAVAHPSFTLFLLLASCVAGLKAYFDMGRAEDLLLRLKRPLFSAVWPGATADEMQRQVADRVEDKLRQTPYLDYVRTYCLPERMLVDGATQGYDSAKEVPEAWYQLRKKL